MTGAVPGAILSVHPVLPRLGLHVVYPAGVMARDGLLLSKHQVRYLRSQMMMQMHAAAGGSEWW